jgi:hypothetical protein
MLNSHSCVGVAQSAFYIPTLFMAFAMVLQRRGNVIFPWLFITIFSLGEYTCGKIKSVANDQSELLEASSWSRTNTTWIRKAGRLRLSYSKGRAFSHC